MEQRTTLQDATRGIELCPQRLISDEMPKGYDWKGSAAIRSAQADTVAALRDAGRVLLRPSGTEPVLRVMVEAGEAGLAQSLARRIAATIPATL